MLAVHNLFKHFANVPALQDVSLTVGPNEIIALLGPSGCGKSTLLRVIAGLEAADAGSIAFAGQALDRLPTHARGFGLMFQDYALFPHLNVAANIAYGLHAQHANRATIKQRVAELLELVGLAGYELRRVDALSGGERQRVALARSLAPNPRLLMLDEPFSALDRSLRERLLGELRTILKHVAIPSIYVTHDQAEAFAIADRLVLMNTGQIIQQGPPEDVYRQPATLFAARFFGLNNLVPATVAETDGVDILLDTALGRLHARTTTRCIAGMRVCAVLRPEAASVGRSDENQIQAVLHERIFRGGTTRISIATALAEPLVFEVNAHNLPAIGAQLTLTLDPNGISVLCDAEGG